MFVFVYNYIYKYFIALICKDDSPRYIMPRYIYLYLLGCEGGGGVVRGEGGYFICKLTNGGLK